ncbi:g9425 [Coccomyxa elongata]
MVNKKLVIAVDNSKECLKAVDFALEHFPTGYTYHLVHLQPRPLASYYIFNPIIPEYGYDELQATEKMLASYNFMDEVFAPKARSAGADILPMVLTVDSDSSSDIGAAICEYAESVNADALIMMRQNKSAISRFFMGSVTRYCAVHSAAPVTIVPGSA